MLTTLDVVNAQLATMGEAPLTDLTVPHPYVAAGLNYLRRHSRQFQTLGWWFNTVMLTITPDPSDQTITGQLPCGVLTLRAPAGYSLVMRGEKLYDNLAGDYLSTRVEGVRVTYELPFEDLPPTAQQYAMDKAVLAFQKDYDGSDRKTQLIQQDVNSSYVLMNTEHIRTMKANKLRSEGTLRAILAIRGDINTGLPVR